MEYGVILQARVGSTRRPFKVVHEILGEPLIYHQIKRLISKDITSEQVIIATTKKKEDDIIEAIANEVGVACFRGSENDVLDRYYAAAQMHEIENVVRLCGDDPLVDPACVMALIDEHKRGGQDHCTAHHRKGWIYGTSAELFSGEALAKAHLQASTISDREHVSPYVTRNADLFSSVRISPENSAEVRPDIYLTVDFEEDVNVVEQVMLQLAEQDKLYDFSQMDLIKVYDTGNLDINNRHLHKGFLN